MSNERVPPQNIEAEQSFLGSLLVDRDAILKVADMLREDDFYKPAHGDIYEAILDLHAKREPIDLLTLANRLSEAGKLESVGGRTYLMELTTIVPTAAHVKNYAEIIQKKATLRRLQSAAGDIINMSYDEIEDVDGMLDDAEQTIFKVSQKYMKTSFTPLKDALDGAFERIDELHREKGKLRGITTGYRDLDNLLGGLQKSDLIILAARPSVGKTSFALDIARQAAVKSKLPVGIFSLEMSKEQLVDRMICAEAGVDLWKLRTGNLSDRDDQGDFSRIGHALGALSEAPIFIDDTANVNIMEIRTKARRLQSEHGLGMLVIDYLQLMESRRTRDSDNRTQEVAEITRALKGIARELDIPVIALSQLSRTTEMSKPAIPKLSHLRESGCLTGDTLITLADGSRARMADLAARTKQTPLKIKALDEHWKLKTATISRVFPSGIKEVFLMKTASGRTIKASANHPFRTLSGWQRLDELQSADLIALPRQLQRSEKLRGNMSDDELILLAHLLGDGCILPNQPFHYTSADPVNLGFVAKTAKSLFDIKTRKVQQKNWWHLYLPSPIQLARGKRHPITIWFEKLGLSLVRAPEKVLPEKLFSQPDEKIALFLKHLWATDGNISDKNLPGRLASAAIYYSSSSEILSRQVQELLLSLGIWGVLRRVPQGKYRPSWQVHIQGKENQLRFLKEIGCVGQRGLAAKRCLIALAKIKTNPNSDIIPKNAWKNEIYPVMQQHGLSWRGLAEGLHMSYCGSTLFKSGLSRERMSKVASLLKEKKLEKLACSDIRWDKIISIESLGEQETYDATVPKLHNFIANGFIVHNSIEQDADVVMFIYRKAADKNYKTEEIPLDERYLAEIHVAKHRNGPCGVIKMYFDEARVSFRDLDKKYASGSHYTAPPPAQEVPSPQPRPQLAPVGVVMPSPGPGSIPPGNSAGFKHSNAPEPNF
ncbi:MAG: replicative DNA helicase [Patescibacteria group bacterium]